MSNQEFPDNGIDPELNHNPKESREEIPGESTPREEQPATEETRQPQEETAGAPGEPARQDSDAVAPGVNERAPEPAESRPVPDENNEEIENGPSKEEIIDDLAHIIEAIIFASDEPLPVSQIKSVLDAAHTFGRVNPDVIVARIEALNKKYDGDGFGFRIVEIANGFQYATRKEMAQWVSILFKERAKRKLSNSALESLAIIAYKQPVTKPEIEAIRGVNVDYVLHSLLEKEIVTVVGRAETVGRPLLYGTTQKFLKIFGLKNLEDLPKLREIDDIIKEIRSKGAEESIQLEITALTEQPIVDAGPQTGPEGQAGTGDISGGLPEGE